MSPQKYSVRLRTHARVRVALFRMLRAFLVLIYALLLLATRSFSTRLCSGHVMSTAPCPDDFAGAHAGAPPQVAPLGAGGPQGGGKTTKHAGGAPRGHHGGHLDLRDDKATDRERKADARAAANTAQASKVSATPAAHFCGFGNPPPSTPCAGCKHKRACRCWHVLRRCHRRPPAT
jgi:hypothetical protein